MKTKLALSAVAAAIAMFSQGAFAQASAPAMRADVKADAKAATKAPTGEAQTMSKQPSTMSDKSRAERKETTKMDAKSGQIPAAGEAGSSKDAGAKSAVSAGSETTRAERKSKTRAANKAGEIPKAGEAGGGKGPGLEDRKKP